MLRQCVAAVCCSSVLQQCVAVRCRHNDPVKEREECVNYSCVYACLRVRIFVKMMILCIFEMFVYVMCVNVCVCDDIWQAKIHFYISCVYTCLWV